MVAGDAALCEDPWLSVLQLLLRFDVRVVRDLDGNWLSSGCSYSYGIRPALKLNSCLSVSLDGDDEEEKDGECDNYHVDLARVDTLTLIREVERRLSEPVTCEAPDECGCEVEQQ